MRVYNLLKYDIKLQIRSGYWTVYGILGLVFILVIFNLSPDFREIVAAYIIFSDTSVLGLLFVGAIVLLEKQQGVLNSLSVTPLSLDLYMFGKILPLTVLSILVSSAIWLSATGTMQNYVLLLSGVSLSSIVFTIFGLGMAAGANSFNQFTARVIVGSLILVLPVFPFIISPFGKWLIFLPMNATVDLYLRIIDDSFSYMQIVDLLIMAIWIFLMRLFAIKQFHKNMMFL